MTFWVTFQESTLRHIGELTIGEFTGNSLFRNGLSDLLYFQWGTRQDTPKRQWEPRLRSQEISTSILYLNHGVD